MPFGGFMLFSDLWFLVILGLITGAVFTTGILLYLDCKLRLKNNTGWPGMFTGPYWFLAIGLGLGYICHIHISRLFESGIKVIT